MNPIILLMTFLVVVGGVGLILGGPALGGSAVGLVLAIALILHLMGNFSERA